MRYLRDLVKLKTDGSLETSPRTDYGIGQKYSFNAFKNSTCEEHFMSHLNQLLFSFQSYLILPTGLAHLGAVFGVPPGARAVGVGAQV